MASSSESNHLRPTATCNRVRNRGDSRILTAFSLTLRWLDTRTQDANDSTSPPWLSVLISCVSAIGSVIELGDYYADLRGPVGDARSCEARRRPSSHDAQLMRLEYMIVIEG